MSTKKLRSITLTDLQCHELLNLVNIEIEIQGDMGDDPKESAALLKELKILKGILS